MSTIDLLQGPGPEPEPAEAKIAARSPLNLFWRRLRRDKVAMTALVFIVVLILVAIFAKQVVELFNAPGPYARDVGALDDFGLPDGDTSDGDGADGAAFAPGHPFGVDEIGRDVFSRTVYGARASLMVAFIATFISVAIGTTVGMIAGYYRGWVDTVLSRIMDVQLAFPVLLLAIGLGAACSLGDGCLSADTAGTVIAVFFGALALLVAATALRAGPGRLVPAAVLAVLALLGLVWSITDDSQGVLKPGLPVVIFVIALAQWPYMARIIRGQTLSLREKEFVEAAESLGASNARIIFREILPNLVAPIIVFSTVLIPTNILFEAALSFLGVGVQPPTPSWGDMISEATNIFDIAWWFMLFPGLALLLTVLAFNLVGDGLQDALNPRGRK